MGEVLTEELLNELLFTDSLAAFLDAAAAQQPETLAGLLTRLAAEKGMQKSEVIRAAGLTPTFGYQLFSGERGAGRNTLLQLCFALGLDHRQAQRLLNAGGASGLYCKNRRDAIIIHGLGQGQTLRQADETLFAFGEATICGE